MANQNNTPKMSKNKSATVQEEKQGREGERRPLLGKSSIVNSSTSRTSVIPGETTNIVSSNTNITTSSKSQNKTSLSKPTRTRQSLRSFRRKGRDENEFELWRGRIGVHVECDEFQLKELEALLAEKLPGWDYVNHYDVLRLWQRPVYNNDGLQQLLPVETREIFIFSFGAVVFFNFSNPEKESQWMQTYLFSSSSLEKEHVYGTRHDVRAIESACDDMEFNYGETFSLKHDMCCFMSREPGEKLAVSFALAKSSLLSIYEWTLEQTIARNSHITEHLAKTGTIPMHKEDLSKEIGRIFLVMHMIAICKTHLKNSGRTTNFLFSMKSP